MDFSSFDIFFTYFQWVPRLGARETGIALQLLSLQTSGPCC